MCVIFLAHIKICDYHDILSKKKWFIDNDPNDYLQVDLASVKLLQRVVTEALTSQTYVEQTRGPLMIISPSIRHMFSHLTATYSKASSGKPYVLDTPIYKKMNNANGSQMGLGYSLHLCRLAKPPLKS